MMDDLKEAREILDDTWSKWRKNGAIPPVPPVDNGDGKDDDGGMNERITKLETTLEHTVKTLDTIQRRMDDGFKEVRGDASANFRVMVGIQITTLVAILGLLAKAAKLF